MAYLTDKQRSAARRQACRSMEDLIKTADRLGTCRDKLPFDSPEAHLFSQALGSLIDARQNLAIIANRCK